MPDLSAFTALFEALKALSEFTKSGLDTWDGVLGKNKIFEHNRQIISAQQSAMAANLAHADLVERVRDLEKQIADLEEWNREKSRCRRVPRS